MKYTHLVDLYNYTKMAKKFIVLSVQHKPQRLYTHDIKKVHSLKRRCSPPVPSFWDREEKTYVSDTEESSLAEESHII
jgi:hypothetical protein